MAIRVADRKTFGDDELKTAKNIVFEGAEVRLVVREGVVSDDELCYWQDAWYFVEMEYQTSMTDRVKRIRAFQKFEEMPKYLQKVAEHVELSADGSVM